MLCRTAHQHILVYFLSLRAQDLEAQCAASSQAYAAASTAFDELRKQLAAAQAAAAKSDRDHRTTIEALEVPAVCMTT
jgi:hypothetical protein